MLTKTLLSILMFAYVSYANNMTKTDPAIVIVGGGAAGIAAATRLLQNNFRNVTILEAERRLGGRIHTVHLDGTLVDMGAEYCHGQTGNIVYSLAKEFLESYEGREQLFYSTGEVLDPAIRQKIENITESLRSSIGSGALEACNNLQSVGECLPIKIEEWAATAKSPRERQIVLDASQLIAASIAGMDSLFDLDDLTIATAYKRCAGDAMLKFKKGGFKTILELMMDDWQIDDKIHLGHKVRHIGGWRNRGAHPVTVTTESGGIFKADHVIFTPSVGVLKADHKRLFDPALAPCKVDAINRIGYGAIVKVQMRFHYKWWDEGFMALLLWSAKDKEILMEARLNWLMNIAGLTHQGGEDCKILTAWFAGKFAPDIELLAEEELKTGLNYLLDKFLSAHYNVTWNFEVLRSNWYHNPNFRGTYSYESVEGHSSGRSGFQDVLAEPLINKVAVPTVLFAGEATHPYYFSTVHGAIETGHREADRLIKFYRREPTGGK